MRARSEARCRMGENESLPIIMAAANKMIDGPRPDRRHAVETAEEPPKCMRVIIEGWLSGDQRHSRQ